MDVNDLKTKIENQELSAFDATSEEHTFARRMCMTAFESPDESSLLGLLQAKKDSDQIMERLGKLAFAALMEEEYDARAFLLFSTFCSPSRATLLAKYVKALNNPEKPSVWYQLVSFLLCSKITAKQDVIKLIKRLLSQNPLLITKITKFI